MPRKRLRKEDCEPKHRLTENQEKPNERLATYIIQYLQTLYKDELEFQRTNEHIQLDAHISHINDLGSFAALAVWAGVPSEDWENLLDDLYARTHNMILAKEGYSSEYSLNTGESFSPEAYEAAESYLLGLVRTGQIEKMWNLIDAHFKSFDQYFFSASGMHFSDLITWVDSSAEFNVLAPNSANEDWFLNAYTLELDFLETCLSYLVSARNATLAFNLNESRSGFFLTYKFAQALINNVASLEDSAVLETLWSTLAVEVGKRESYLGSDYQSLKISGEFVEGDSLESGGDIALLSVQSRFYSQTDESIPPRQRVFDEIEMLQRQMVLIERNLKRLEIEAAYKNDIYVAESRLDTISPDILLAALNNLLFNNVEGPTSKLAHYLLQRLTALCQEFPNRGIEHMLLSLAGMCVRREETTEVTREILFSENKFLLSSLFYPDGVLTFNSMQYIASVFEICLQGGWEDHVLATFLELQETFPDLVIIAEHTYNFFLQVFFAMAEIDPQEALINIENLQASPLQVDLYRDVLLYISGRKGWVGKPEWRAARWKNQLKKLIRIQKPLNFPTAIEISDITASVEDDPAVSSEFLEKYAADTEYQEAKGENLLSPSNEADDKKTEELSAQKLADVEFFQQYPNQKFLTEYALMAVVSGNWEIVLEILKSHYSSSTTENSILYGMSEKIHFSELLPGRPSA